MEIAESLTDIDSDDDKALTSNPGKQIAGGLDHRSPGLDTRLNIGHRSPGLKMMHQSPGRFLPTVDDMNPSTFGVPRSNTDKMMSTKQHMMPANPLAYNMGIDDRSVRNGSLEYIDEDRFTTPKRPKTNPTSTSAPAALASQTGETPASGFLNNTSTPRSENRKITSPRSFACSMPKESNGFPWKTDGLSQSQPTTLAPIDERPSSQPTRKLTKAPTEEMKMTKLELLTGFRSACNSMAAGSENVMAGSIASKKSSLTLTEEINRLVALMPQDLVKLAALDSPSAEGAVEEEYIKRLAKAGPVHFADISLSGGAAFKRLVEELAATVRDIQWAQCSPPQKIPKKTNTSNQDLLTAQLIKLVARKMSWKVTIVELLPVWGKSKLMKKAQYMAQRVRWFLSHQEECVREWLENLERDPMCCGRGSLHASSSMIQIDTFHRRGREALLLPQVAQGVHDAFQLAASSTAKWFLEQLISIIDLQLDLCAQRITSNEQHDSTKIEETSPNPVAETTASEKENSSAENKSESATIEDTVPCDNETAAETVPAETVSVDTVPVDNVEEKEVPPSKWMLPFNRTLMTRDIVQNLDNANSALEEGFNETNKGITESISPLCIRALKRFHKTDLPRAFRSMEVILESKFRKNQPAKRGREN